MSAAHEKAVVAQFGPQARAYVESAVHAEGADLEALETIVCELKPAHALDLGAGGGHVAYRMAPHSRMVTACDLSSEMLAAVAATARERRLDNIRTAQGAAERLPFDSGAFDFLATRYSAHHWRAFEAGLREARRVLKPGARAVFMDAFAPGQALFDTHLQAIELLRDTSHCRDYSAAEWTRGLGQAGFALIGVRTWRLRLDFASWIARMRTPEVNASAIRALQKSASAETKAHFAVEDDGSFQLDVMMAEAVSE